MNEPPAIVLLGKLGDIVNALPIAKALADRHGAPVPFVTARRYCAVLEGCTYVVSEPFEGDFFTGLNEAIDAARKRHGRVLNLQTNWAGVRFERKARSFCEEAYVVAGLERGQHALVFDRRSPEREAELVRRVRAGDERPLVLYNLVGHASPLGCVDEFEAWLQTTFGQRVALRRTPVVERFYDLLGLYEAAAALITIDTATLHLAPAAPRLPYIFFSPDRYARWHASVPLGRCVLEVLYGAVLSNLSVIGRRLEEATGTAPNPERVSVLMGRNGDIVNLLPALAQEARTTRQPIRLMLGNAYAPLLEGVSYVTALPLPLGPGDLNEGLVAAHRQFREVRNLQVHGNGVDRVTHSTHYNQDAWGLAGKLDRFDDTAMRPVFDVRNPRREAELIARLMPDDDDRPVCLLAVSGGESSPFSAHPWFTQKLTEMLADRWRIVDLNAMRFERLFDALGLIEAADTLITSDSVYLHLAAATSTPVVALLSGWSSWLQTAPRCQVALSMGYGEVASRFDEIRGALSNVAMRRRKRIEAPPFLIHAVDNYWRAHIGEERHRAAFESWLALAHTERWLSAVKTDPPRTTRNLKSHIAAPYLKDVLRAALDRARADDIVVWTNSDTIILPAAANAIRDALQTVPVVVSRRVDRVTRCPHPGRDLAAFRADWLWSNLDGMPDFALGHPEFDVYLGLLARKLVGLDAVASDLYRDLPPADLRAGLILHQDHGTPAWDRPENRRRSPGNVHNLKLLREWCRAHMTHVKFTSGGEVDWRKEPVPC